jgi:hypothetical protein
MPHTWTTPWEPFAIPFAARLAFPWLDRAPWLGVAALAATVAALAAAPARARRALLPAAALAWLAAGSSLSFAASFAAAACLQALVLRSRAALAPRLAAVAACAAALLAASRLVGGFPGAAAWQLAALAAVRAVSAAADSGTEGASARELFLYLCGGLPASFLGAYHGFSVFREAAAAERPRAAGLRDLAAGLAWLVFSAAVRSAAGPGRADPWAYSFSGFWAFSAASWAAELAMWIGAYRVIEGLSRLCGYDLPNQFDRPWLSTSPLDFWRRYSTQNRTYLLKYVFFPLSRLGASPAAGIAAAFAVSAALNALRFSGVFLAGGGGWRSAAAATTTFALFFMTFGVGAVVETVLRPPPARPGRRRALRVAAMTAAVVWLWAPLNFWPSPERAAPRAAASLWARAARRLLIP